VHGFGGNRYGDNSTWGKFPEFIYDDFPNFDVGLYEYRTSLRRLKFWESVSLSAEAKVLAGIIRDIKDYQIIILIGHSMGGLLCMAAIADLINTRQQESLARIGGLILMATPQTGSLRVPTFLSWLFQDFRALKPHGDFVTGLHDTLINNQVSLDETRGQPESVVIPTWAVLGASDHWVDKLSAGLNLSDARKRTVRGSHEAIVKPKSKRSDAYEYVQSRIVEACSLRGITIEQRGIQLNLDGADPTPYHYGLRLLKQLRDDGLMDDEVVIEIQKQTGYEIMSKSGERS